MNKVILGIVAVLLIGGSFYGGMNYGKSSVAVMSTLNRSNFQGGNGGVRGTRVGANGGGASGEIVSMSNSIITLKLRDGSSKLVIFSSSTPVREVTTSDVDPEQLQVGKSISVLGAANSDGSITAESIQLRTSSTPAFGR
ncbi:MAG: hypothetical protein AAB467_03165 [Patescibacteria group bacterium]